MFNFKSLPYSQKHFIYLVQWMKGTKDITNAARTVKEVHNDFIRFSIKEALTTDEGAYFIVARNRYGIDRCFTKVMVSRAIMQQTYIF